MYAYCQIHSSFFKMWVFICVHFGAVHRLCAKLSWMFRKGYFTFSITHNQINSSCGTLALSKIQLHCLFLLKGTGTHSRLCLIVFRHAETLQPVKLITLS